MFIDVIAESLNAYPPISNKPSGRLTDATSLFAKAYSPMYRSVEGSVILFMPLLL